MDKITIEKLLEIMAALRDPAGGCPWDLEQRFSTIAPYTIEEAYEVADAIDRGDMRALEGELGDLLFQVVYHARMASEAGEFDFADVVAGICAKMIRRHPHVFGDAAVAGAAEQTEAWETQKAAERRAAGKARVLADVPRALPGLSRAVKLGRRASRVGFDWASAAGVREKLAEELGELDETLAGGQREAQRAEIGDVLFCLANLCRHLELDPEQCLREANARFESRFAHIEDRVAETGLGWDAQAPERLEAWWSEAKTRE